jgi:hypothetical protein
MKRIQKPNKAERSLMVRELILVSFCEYLNNIGDKHLRPYCVSKTAYTVGGYNSVLVPLILSRITVDWMIRFIAPYTFVQFVSSNTALSLLCALYSSPLYTH